MQLRMPSLQFSATQVQQHFKSSSRTTGGEKNTFSSRELMSSRFPRSGKGESGQLPILMLVKHRAKCSSFSLLWLSTARSCGSQTGVAQIGKNQIVTHGMTENSRRDSYYVGGPKTNSADAGSGRCLAGPIVCQLQTPTTGRHRRKSYQSMMFCASRFVFCSNGYDTTVLALTGETYLQGFLRWCRILSIHCMLMASLEPCSARKIDLF